MKKLVAAVLILVYCLSICACGKSVDTATPAEDLSGTYKNIAFLPKATITLNEDGTYDREVPHQKGTYTGNSTGGFTLLDASGYNEINFNKKDSYYYRTTLICCFEEDEEYGQAPTFTNGVSNQWFCAYYNNISNSEWNVIILELREDGTFKLHDCTRTTTSQKNGTIYEGTYTLDDYVLNLNYSNGSIPFLFIDNKIYFDVFEKQ